MGNKNIADHLITWVGGKRLLRKTIIELIPYDKIKSYIEPFGGGAWVLFGKDKHAKLEVYNDLDNRLTNLFKIPKKVIFVMIFAIQFNSFIIIIMFLFFVSFINIIINILKNFLSSFSCFC